MTGKSGSEAVSTKLQWVAELARNAPTMVLTTLAHRIDYEWMLEAYKRTRKSGAVGVDGQTAAEYAADLENNLRRLLERFKSGSYRAPPVRRVHIPKGDGKSTRPIGIPTFEDKVLQRAVVMLLEAVYEQDFKNFSYGFRPGRSAHDAREALRNGLMAMGGGWVLEVDIKNFFDTVVHTTLNQILDQRVGDGVLRRAIGKWLKAGVMEEGLLRKSTSGTPQGGVISPLLANIYLHEVVDLWWDRDVLPRLWGKATLVRYADDVVIAFEREDDARRVLRVLPKRFEKYGLMLHPEKTRLVDFRRPTDGPPTGGPRHVDLLGFRLHWEKSRKGPWVIRRKTAPPRFTRACKSLWLWCKVNRHRPIPVQHRILSSKLLGHYQYFGVTGNYGRLYALHVKAEGAWRKWLSRRSQKGRISWSRFKQLLARHPLPEPRIVHQYRYVV